jgi:transposase
MRHKHGEERNQLLMFSLESSIASNAFVRVVDVFVDSIDLKSFGFDHLVCHSEGCPPYHPAALLKLYLYGYRFGIRSTRKLEREASTNIEAMWLLSGLHPKYKTIADFRKNNSAAFREIFRRFVCLLKEWNLVEGKTVAIDSFKIRASNSLKANYNRAKIKRHIEYIDNQIKEYEAILDKSDNEDDRKEAETKLTERKEKRDGYICIDKKLKESGEEQISLTDPDSRSVILLRNIVNVGYNIQAASDSKHKLLVEYDTGAVNDTHSLAPMALKTKQLLNLDSMDVLADKGYHTGDQIQRCAENNITVYVSPRNPSTNDVSLYPLSMFRYDQGSDTYTCPAGCILRTNKKWYNHSEKHHKEGTGYRFQRYTTQECKTCALRQACTKGQYNGRVIDRSEYAGALEENTKRVTQHPDYYRQRQQIAEHMYGTLKRQRGFTHTNLRGKEKVLGEVGLMFIGYNLTRCISILSVEKLISLLRERCFPLVFGIKQAFLRRCKELFLVHIKMVLTLPSDLNAFLLSPVTSH